VALARALVKHPQVLLLDEPLGALDLKLRKELQAQLKAVQRRVGITFVYVTHDQEEAFSMSDRVAVMDEGVLVQVGAPQEVYQRPATLFVADFVGSSNRIAATVESVAGETYRLAAPGGPRFEALGPPGVGVGSAVTVIVRPERISLSGDGIPAVLTDVSYVGPARHLTVDCERLGVMYATVGGADGQVAEGDPVAVSWPSEAAWIVP
jgi:spermidine/putrescine transport system ATP-binding protein